MNANHLPGNMQGLIQALSPESNLSSLPPEDIKLIWQAYQTALDLAKANRPEDASQHLIHLLETAKILVHYRLDAEAVIAAFLYTFFNDISPGITLPEIEKRFGPNVAKLVDGVARLNQIDYLTSPNANNSVEQAKAEGFRKMFLAMVDDVRVVLIKLAARLHTMRVLHTLPAGKQNHIARETIEIMAPLANRLGIWQLKWELEDRAFRFLDPDSYKNIAAALEHSREEHKETLESIIQTVKELLAEAGYPKEDFEIYGRPKHIYSIYRKLRTPKYQGYGVERIYDKLGVRIITQNQRQCYAVLGLIHTHWEAVPGEFDDYISRKRESGYQSLHTAVKYGPGPNDIVEFQIRDRKMHYEAEYGVAAHWLYKEGVKRDSYVEEKIRWFKRMLVEFQQEGPEDFVNTLKSEFLDERVYCLSPAGDIYDLPQEATPIDFAYHVHTEVGHRCRGAKVNGRLVPLNYQLRNGDQVEILTVKRGGPSRDWLMPQLGLVKTSRARSKIRQWYRQQDREKSIAEGRAQIERELKRLSLTDISFEQLAQLLDYDKVEALFAAVGYGDISVQQITRRAVELLPHEEKDLELPAVRPRPEPASPTSVYIKGMGDLLTRLANCCNPLPGDPVIGYITRGRGATIHRQDCPNILNIADKERLIEADWGEETTETHPVKVLIEAFDRQGLLRDISTLIANEAISMSAATVETSKKDLLAKIMLTLEIADLDQLTQILTRLAQLPNIVEVRRQTG
ncbi:MAG: RelA/SpoT family protein [Anaerolineae bacterium]